MPHENVVAFLPASLRPNWNDAVDRLTAAAEDVHGQLAECLIEAHLATDPEVIDRIARLVKAIEFDAAVTLTAIVDREDRLRQKGA